MAGSLVSGEECTDDKGQGKEAKIRQCDVTISWVLREEWRGNKGKRKDERGKRE